MPRAKQRTDELRDHVVQVAIAVLARDGVAGFTTRKVAREAGTSTPAVYELFGNKGGLVREVFFEGFRLLRGRFEQLERSDNPVSDLVDAVQMWRRFVGENPVLAEVMFSRPFSDFEPGPQELAAGSSVREFIVESVRRCVDAGALVGDEADIAHVLVALIQGLVAQETAGWLGTSKGSVDRRWTLAVRGTLAGLAAVPLERR